MPRTKPQEQELDHETLRLEDVKRMDKDFLIPAEVAEIIGCDPHVLRLTAARDPAALGFPVCRVGNRTKVPRIAFVKWMEGER